MASAFIGIGSNLGDRVKNCTDAIGRIARIASVEACSSLYETEPVGLENQPWFINAVIRVATSLTPYELIGALLRLEQEMGRTRYVRRGPRVIDLDLLFYEDFIIETPVLIVPHPEAHRRRFVLAPLCEIDEEVLHPKLRKVSGELLESLQDDTEVKRVFPPPLLPSPCAF